MSTYERVVDGRVVERVTPIEGDFEDTRLGLLAMEDGSEWRIAAVEQTSTPQKRK
jgi:hypothetical protein